MWPLVAIVYFIHKTTVVAGLRGEADHAFNILSLIYCFTYAPALDCQ